MKVLLPLLLCLLMLGCGGDTDTPANDAAEGDTPDAANGVAGDGASDANAYSRPATFDAPEEAFEAYMQAMNSRDWQAVAQTLEPTWVHARYMSISGYIAETLAFSPENHARTQELDQLAPTDTSVEQADRFNTAAYPFAFEVLVGEAEVVVQPVRGLEERTIENDAFEGRWTGTEVWEVDGREVSFQTDIVYSDGSWWVLGWSPEEIQRALDRE